MAVFSAKLVKKGDREGETIALKDLTRIGRNPDNDIVLDTMGISRYHAVIEVKANGYCVTDNASINGTFVNGERVNTCQLVGGEIITFGNVADFHFVVDAVSEPKSELASARLVVSGGELEGQEFLLYNTETVIGRQEDCDIVIPYSGVSRNHARIIRDASKTVIVDLGSSNGTYVNGKKISNRALKHGDTITIDIYRFTFLDERGGERHISEAGASKNFVQGRVLHRNRTVTLSLVAASILLCVGLVSVVAWYVSVDRSIDPIAFFRPIEVYSEKDMYRAAQGHIIRGLEEYENSNLATTKEQFDIAIDILHTGLTADYSYSLEEREVFEMITRNLPENYLRYDLGQIYKETLRQTKEVTIVSEEERKAFAKQQLKRILKKFGQDKYQIPPVFFNRVDFYVDTFQNSQKGFFSRSLVRSNKYFPMIKSIFQKYNLPQELGYIALIESGFNPEALSKAGAKGIWQFMPATGKQYGLRINKVVDERRDPLKSTHAASKYIKNLLMDFGADSFMLAMAAYNAGEGRVRGALRKGKDPFEERSFWHIVQRGTLKEETNEYVPKILAAMIISENPALFGFPAKKEPHYETISVGSGTSLLLIAELCSTTVDEIRDSNPDLPADAVSTPLAAPRFNLKIPYGFKKMVLAELDKLAGKRNSN